ncbi:MAG: undecaprenyldiphospho-muramoylpentapeptide beta-N-acetylglucosaminyltransferase [Candidatus Omnitrophota bacterium]|jgi:UDP-N-acetylglucosamine--N-acetylmuramyl-(pentapeptide) pyrophosphoryl-undecaprenol N-acetylglucosamine transferase
MRILIAAGGSGGHIFPAVALARKLKEKEGSVDILFVGSDKAIDKSIFIKEGFRYALLSSNKLSYKKSIKTVIFFLRLILDSIRSFFIVASYRPDSVAGFGGYVSAPISLAAYILRVPVIAHEQNVVPGRANKILFNIARTIALSFKETGSRLGKNAAKVVFTGNPIRATLVRSDRAESLKKHGFGADKFTMLVMGGSQGAHVLNEKFVHAVSMMEESARKNIQVIHITGIKDYSWAVREYEKMGIDHRVYSFTDNIEDAYSASDLVVTRSGASAIFEVALFGKPMILVPYPFAMSHQAENARVFTKNGAAIEIDEKDLQPEVFRDRIVSLINNRSALDALASGARKMGMPQASDDLAQAVLRVSKGT